MTVTGTREKAPLAETPVSIGAIQADDIHTTAPLHPGQILGQVPGVAVAITNGEGHTTAIRQPFTTSPVYLFLEDGVPIRATGFFNHNALYEVNIPMAGGIEVVRGPGTALYGSDAIGGIVNILSHAPSPQTRFGLSAEGGAFGTWRVMGSGGGAVNDFKAADHVCECCRIALLARDDGTVTAMWRHVFEPNIRDHATATLSADGTAGAVQRVTFEDWRIDACPHHGPALVADAKGRLHAVWFSAAPNSRGFYYGRLRDGGVDGLRRLGSDTAGHGDIAVNGSRVVVVWRDYVDGRSRLVVSISEDGGNAWRDSELSSVAGPSDYPCLLRQGERTFVFWNSREKALGLLPVP